MRKELIVEKSNVGACPDTVGSLSQEWEDKVWGKTCVALDTPKKSRHLLQVIGLGVYCSWHKHNNRSNAFEVIEGHIRVVCGVTTPESVVSSLVVDLKPGSYLLVPALIFHQFQSLTNYSYVIETYYPDPGPVSLSDIVRASVGGKCENFDPNDPPRPLR